MNNHFDEKRVYNYNMYVYIYVVHSTQSGYVMFPCQNCELCFNVSAKSSENTFFFRSRMCQYVTACEHKSYRISNWFENRGKETTLATVVHPLSHKISSPFARNRMQRHNISR